jgi:citrate lyase beta subunit
MRSLLFAGATRPDLVAKLGRSAPDAVAIDLEDAVPAEAKDEARAALLELVPSVEGARVPEVESAAELFGASAAEVERSGER